MSHNWLHTPDCKVYNEELSQALLNFDSWRPCKALLVNMWLSSPVGPNMKHKTMECAVTTCFLSPSRNTCLHTCTDNDWHTCLALRTCTTGHVLWTVNDWVDQHFDVVLNQAFCPLCVCLVMPSMQRKKKRKKCHQCYTQFSMTTLTTPQLPMLWHVIFDGHLVWLSISWHNVYTTTSYDIDHHNIAYLATHRSRRRRWVHVRAVTLGHWKRAANAATCNSRMSWDDWCWFVLHSMYYTARLSSCCPSKEAGWHCCILSVSQA